jgi:hypothetical protein
MENKKEDADDGGLLIPNPNTTGSERRFVNFAD